MTGEAFTFVAPDEEADVRAIERAVRQTLPRVTLPDFDYKASGAQLEIPLRQRIAEIRKRKAEERSRRPSGARLPPAHAHAARPAQGPRRRRRIGV